MMLRRNISTTVAAAIAAATVVSIAGCGGKSNTAENDTANVSQKVEINYEELMESISDPEDYKYSEEITLNIPVYDRAQSGLPDVTDNYWTKYVQKNFGDKHNIKLNYIAVPRASAVSEFEKLLKKPGKEQPDIVFDYDYPVAANFANNGVCRELTNDFVKYFAPDYYEYTKDLDEYSYLNGEKLFLLGRRPRAYNYVTLVRKDWIDKAKDEGLIDFDEPHNEEERVKMYKAFRDLKLGGSETYPMNASLGGSNYGAYAYRPYPLSDEDNALYSDITVCALTWEPVKEALKQENMYYHEGLIPSDWYLDKDGAVAQERFVAGKAGTFDCYLTKSPDIIAELKRNDHEAEVTVLGCYPDPGITDPDTGENIPTPARAYYPYGLISGINMSCEHPEAVLMYYEWMYDNLFTMQNGIEGKTYEMEDVTGTASLKAHSAEIPVIKDYKGEERLNYNNNKDMWSIVVEGKELRDKEHPDEWINVLAQEVTYAPEGYEWIIEKAYDNYEKSKDYQYTDYAFSSSIDSLTKSSGVLLDKWQTAHKELVTCDPDEFEEKYEQLSKEYLDAGYGEVLKEKKEKFNEEQKKKKAD